jgi:exopolysaccharide production protein ExoZ
MLVNGEFVPPKHRQLAGIQYGRGIAALLVVLYHAATQVRADPAYISKASEVLEYGNIGVPIFFVISGFIICFVSLDANFKPLLSHSSFVEKRFVRIIPFMWAAIILYNAVSFVGTRSVEWGPFVRALSLWPSGSVKPNVIWTLRHEAIFYTMFALSFLGSGRTKWLLALWCLAPLAIYTAVPTLYPPIKAFSDRGFFQIFLSDANVTFGAGIVLGLLTLRYRENLISTWKGGPWLVYGAAVAMMIACWGLSLGYGLVSSLIVTILASAVAVVCIKIAPDDSLASRAASFLGNASYSVYLFHNLALVVLIKLGHKALPLVGTSGVYIACVACAVALGIAGHVFIEKPIIRFLAARMPTRARPFIEQPTPLVQ